METHLEHLEDNKVKVDVTLDAAEIDKRIKRTYRDFARRYRFPGFRAGKAPRPVIDNALGADAVKAAVAEDAINETYPLVIEQERLYPTGKPEFDEDELPQDGEPYAFSFTVQVTPEVELSTYEPPAIELPPEEATESEIASQIESYRGYYASYEDAGPDAETALGDNVELSIKATDESGDEIEALASESRLYTPGTGLFSAAFDEEIVGMKSGETKEFDLAIPEGEEGLLLSSYAGKTLHFTVSCLSVKNKKLPEVTDEWVKEVFKMDSVDDLRKEVATTIKDQKAELIPRMKESAVVADLIKRVDDEPPAAMVEEQESNLLQDFFTNLQRQSVTFDSYLAESGMTSDEFKEEIAKQARDEALRALALDAWAREKNIEVSDEEITEEFVKAGLEDPKAAEEQWRQNGRLYLIRQELLREKALDDVTDAAVVTEVDFAARNGEDDETASESEDGADQS